MSFEILVSVIESAENIGSFSVGVQERVQFNVLISVWVCVYQRDTVFTLSTCVSLLWELASCPTFTSIN